jgi:hypothetical protein
MGKRLRPGELDTEWEDAATEAKRPKLDNPVFARARGEAQSTQAVEAAALRQLPALFGTHEEFAKHITEPLQARLKSSPALATAYVAIIQDRVGMQKFVNRLRVRRVGLAPSRRSVDVGAARRRLRVGRETFTKSSSQASSAAPSRLSSTSLNVARR